jgi:hypothetical protein
MYGNQKSWLHTDKLRPKHYVIPQIFDCFLEPAPNCPIAPRSPQKESERGNGLRDEASAAAKCLGVDQVDDGFFAAATNVLGGKMRPALMKNNLNR